MISNLEELPPEWKRVNVLINNAGLSQGLDPIQNGSYDDWETMIDTNIKGLLYVSKVVSNWMINNQTGHIINIGSTAAKEVYEKGNVMVVEVSDIEGIKSIGCNSLWCFTYGRNIKDWNTYSYDSLVYVIIDFSQKPDSMEFMYVLIKPLDINTEEEEDEDFEGNVDSPLFNMANEQDDRPIGTLSYLLGKENLEKIFTWQ